VPKSARVLDHRHVAVVGRVAAALGVGVGTGAVGVGSVGVSWFYSNLLLDTRQQPVFPETVLAADASRVALSPTRLAGQPGIWGLRWAGGLTRLGPVLRRHADRVDRPLLGGPVPPAGTRATIDLGPFDPDPGSRGLAFREVHVATPLGPAPAWFVPADAAGDRSGTWVVMVHGRGGTRREGLRVLPALHRRGHPALMITYRNDEGAPASPDRRYHLGDTEWEDLEAAVRYARALGAEQVVLYGWSMGAAIVGAFLDRSAEAAAVAAVLWDAPLVDWRATLRQQARNRRLPTWLIPATTAITSRRIGIDFDRFDLLSRPPSVRPPTLVVHSSDDTAVPVAPSRALAAAAPRLDWPMRYLEVPGVEHTGSWNADPAGYERAVLAFLAEHLH
jgi:alpha-beta hydrolase superfamily lysophospholipase